MLDKKNRIAPLRTLLTSILQTFIMAEHDNASLLSGISNFRFSDLEDACNMNWHCVLIVIYCSR